MTSDSFIRLVGCRLPLQVAALGEVSTAALAAAVSEAGGLGMIARDKPDDVAVALRDVRAASTGPVGANFLIPFMNPVAVDVAARSADVVEFFYGRPDPELVARAAVAGAVVGWQVGSAAEAQEAVAAGCRYVVAQGIEAGGHVRGRQRLDEVLAETLVAVDVPVVAAGGIGSRARVVAVLGAGAAAVRIGTRFVAAMEADAHPEYVTRLIEGSAADTELTTLFGAYWPDAPHRVLRSAVEAAQAHPGPTVALDGDRVIGRFESVPPTRRTVGDIAAMALYAGTSVDHVHAVLPARDIVAELMGR
jgi:NAD(P)H-dependent flavin oxidoreductase YrpB (nitropropane dioxygenase family)